MSDLAEFVLARIAEREDKARAAMLSNGYWYRTGAFARATSVVQEFGPVVVPERIGSLAWDENAHIALNDPAYVLARCAADRQIVEEHAAVVPPTGEGKVYCRICVAPGGFGSWSSFRGSVPGVHFPCRTLRLLALPDASHPDYDESWKP